MAKVQTTAQTPSTLATPPGTAAGHPVRTNWREALPTLTSACVACRCVLNRCSAIRLKREPNKFRVGEEWHLLKEKSSVYVVIPAKAGIQGLNNIGRQADSGCQLSLA